MAHMRCKIGKIIISSERIKPQKYGLC